MLVFTMTTFKDRRQPNNDYCVLPAMKQNSRRLLSSQFLSCKSKNNAIIELKVLSHVPQHILAKTLTLPVHLKEKSKTEYAGVKRIKCGRRTRYCLPHPERNRNVGHVSMLYTQGNTVSFESF